MNLNDGKLISDIVEAALKSGDFSKLRELGPVVQQAVTTAITGKPGSQASSTSTSNATVGSASNNNEPIDVEVSFPPPEGKPYCQPPRGRPYQTPTIKSSDNLWSSPSRGRIVRLSKSIAQIILSSIGTLVFGLFALTSLTALPTVQPELINLTVVAAIGAALPTFACLGFLISGINKYKLADRTTRISKLFLQKNVYTFDELAAETGIPVKQIKSDLRKVRAKGLAPELRVDNEETCVMWGQEAYQQYQETQQAYQQRMLEDEERKRRLTDPATANIERFRNEGIATIRKIRAANDAIPCEEISAKLAVLEDTTARIFIYVERYPHKLPDTRKFMSYYLPTTLKLVEKYRQFDEMDFQPENIKQAKLDIKNSLEFINVAFANLLESLFEHETIDVATDIDVLKKMLEQEGLTNKEFKIDPPAGPPAG